MVLIMIRWRQRRGRRRQQQQQPEVGNMNTSVIIETDESLLCNLIRLENKDKLWRTGSHLANLTASTECGRLIRFARHVPIMCRCGPLVVTL